MRRRLTTVAEAVVHRGVEEACAERAQEGKHDLVVQQGKEPSRLGLDQVEHGLIVDERDVVVFDTLRLVKLLLLLERVFVEELLQLLIAVVDTHLLEGVGLENLKAKDVEDADERGGRVVIDELLVAAVIVPRDG